MSESIVHPDLSARVAVLEAQVSELFQLLGAVAPSAREAIESALPADVAELARSGERDAAIRRLIVTDGVSLATAMSRVDGYLRTLGR